MTISLKVGSTVLQLNPDLYWADEDWLPVQQTEQRTVTGSVIISATQLSGGRPITLQPADDNSGWMTKAQLDQLRNWGAVAGQVMELTLRGTVRNVIFRHQDKALDAAPVVFFSDMDSGDYYRVTLRLTEIPQ
jgi:hypothetical protein